MMEPKFPKTPSINAVRTNRWKYICYPEINDIEELYDLKNDPYELKNLASDPAHASDLADMKSEMDAADGRDEGQRVLGQADRGGEGGEIAPESLKR